MGKTISAYINVALADYDESTKNHVVELMKETLREQSIDFILENTWEVVENKRTLYKNENGELEIQEKELLGINETREMLEVMRVVLSVDVV